MGCVLFLLLAGLCQATHALTATLIDGELVSTSIVVAFVAEGQIGNSASAPGQSTFEVAVSPSMNGPYAPGGTADYVWQAGVDTPFTLQYDQNSSLVTFQVEGVTVSHVTLASPADLSDIYVRAHANKPNTSMTVHDLTLQGASVGASVEATGQGNGKNVLHIGGGVLSGGFVLQGLARMDFSTSKNPPKNSQLSFQISVGRDFAQSPIVLDQDGDGIADEDDNCPDTPNPDQADLDGDGLGDVCDPDLENDGVLNTNDNCPTTYNPQQDDLDGDGLGDACDSDRDGDGIADLEDNCLDTPNSDQANLDGDGLGDACDDDRDGDGIANITDNCPDTANPDQADLDGDGLGNACDDDLDGDGIANATDNCPDTTNSDQADLDGDGLGDACDPDLDNDGALNANDNCATTYNPQQEDLDGDGFGNACDDEMDGDQIPNDWEQQYALNEADPSDAALDPDGDGMSNLAEYLAGTNPRDPLSCFKARVVVRSPPVVSWSSASNRTYTIWRATTLRQGAAGFVKIASGIPATAPTTSFTDYNAPDGRAYYYRVQLDIP